MRLISLVLALIFITAIIIYYKNSGSVPEGTNNPLIRNQQAMDKAKQATSDLNKALEKQNKQLEALEKTNP